MCGSREQLRGYEVADFSSSAPLWEGRFQPGFVSKQFISGLVCPRVVGITQAIPPWQLAVPSISKGIL